MKDSYKSPRGNPSTCPHLTYVDMPNGSNCKQCGVFKQKGTQVHGVKEKVQEFAIDTPSLEIVEHLIKDEKTVGQCSQFGGFPFHQKQKFWDKFSTSETLKQRRTLIIDYIFEMGERFKQRLLTIHTAIVYLDQAFLTYSSKITQEKAHLWALSCLLTASKFDELDRHIPYVREL